MRLLVVSDIHYAGAAEKARRGWERRAIRPFPLRWIATFYRRHLWLADPTAHNAQLDAFLERAGSPDWVVANGDYSCDSAFVGVADDAAFDSARECLDRLRAPFQDRFHATLGDHELGKMSLFGGCGGPRLASWHRAIGPLGLQPLWSQPAGRFHLVGITSSLLALPTFLPELLPDERDAWHQLRTRHLESLQALWDAIPQGHRVILFCHDPTALPFLAREPWFQARLPQLACTVIGHLHSEAVLRTSRLLAGMPELAFLGNTARRLSGALRRARHWAPFRVVLCPSPAGIQLRKDGGYLEINLHPNADSPPPVTRHHLPWP
ncbi:MAG: metallophosphoesterase [Verrucomicrobiae bacterium]|nr:metallophosphoesterase [Verrucomicrobiae bacterium]